MTWRVTSAVVVNADITEHHRAAQRLAEANAAMSQVSKRLEQVVANVPGIVWEAWGVPDAPSQRIAPTTGRGFSSARAGRG